MARGSLRQQVQRVKDKIRAAANEATIKVTLDAQASLMEQSPVDTGQFRRHWQVSTDGQTKEVLQAGVAEGAISLATANVYAEGGATHIANPLPYARRLNNSWSDQAPAPGWIEGTFLDIDAAFKAAFAQAWRDLG